MPVPAEAARPAGDAPAPPRFDVHSVVALQRLAGNAAVAGRLAVQRAGPAPTTVDPPDGLMTLGVSSPRGTPLGETSVAGTTYPQWRVDGDEVGGQYEGRVQPTTMGSVGITAQYPAEGLYDLPEGDSGRPRKALLVDVVSNLVRDGEQEHSDDHWWAYELVFRPGVDAINTLATRPAKRGSNVREVNRAWMDDLRALLPPQLRPPTGELSPIGTWIQQFGRLMTVGLQRDPLGWHSMGQRDGTAAERRQHRVPRGTDVVRVLPGGQIGQHPAETRIRTAFAALPPPS